MSIAEAEFFWRAVALYLGVGALFGALYLAIFASRLDHSAKGGSPGFLVTTFPGLALLWPLMLARLLSFRVVNRPNKAPDA